MTRADHDPKAKLAPPAAPPGRLASLDQFRGFAVFGMLIVNYMGGHFLITPDVLKHHPTYITYADAVMPQFFFAAGFAARLTLLRRRTADGAGAAYAHMVRRCFGLMLIGFIVHGIDGGVKSWDELTTLGVGGFFATAFQRNFFQTLTHIAVTTLWVLPVLAAGPGARVAYAALSAVAHVAISASGYYAWDMARPGIDGGPLGFLTWTLPFLAGTLAYDLAPLRPLGRAARLIAAGAGLMALGYGLSCLHGTTAETFSVRLAAPPPLPPHDAADLWTMSQRAGSVSYLTFAAGFALATYALFVLACDGGGLRLPALGPLGRNALVIYILHGLLAGVMKRYTPGDAPAWYAVTAVTVFIGVCVLIARTLDRDRVYIRL